MRLRNIKGAREEMLVNPYVIQEPEAQRGQWHTCFGNNHPIYIEVGMGKGQFLMAQAEKNPERNYIGIEKYSSVLLRALQKRPELSQDNLYFLRFDAEYIDKIFAPGEVAGIYLNFSDPWPKDRHAKRRLTAENFLKRYETFLAPGGVVEFKTDNRDLFAFSLEEVEKAGWELLACTWDLHQDAKLNEGNIMTEYEERFSQKGQAICKLIARPCVKE